MDLRHLPADERRGLLPHRSPAVAGIARQRGGVGRDAIRRHQSHCAPGFLTMNCFTHLITVGGASIGLLAAVGGAALGLGVSVGGLAVGSIAIGGAAVGFVYAIGGGAFGPAVIDGMRCDDAARDF